MKSNLVKETLYTDENISAYINKLFNKAELSLEKTFRDSDEKLKEIINSKNSTENSVLKTPLNNKSGDSVNNYSNKTNTNHSGKKKRKTNNIQFTPSTILKSRNDSSQNQSFNSSNYSSNSNNNRSRNNLNHYHNRNYQNRNKNNNDGNYYNNSSQNYTQSTPNRYYFHKRNNNQYNRHP